MNRRKFTISILFSGIAMNVPVLRTFFGARVKNGWVLKDGDL